MDTEVSLRIDHGERTLAVDPTVTLLDALRERLGITSAKKGCDHGQCGACTVLVDGRRVLACLTLAVTLDGAEVITSAGLAGADRLHPLHQAFIDHDAFQCGYCTPGQICSAAGMLDEARKGWPSVLSSGRRDGQDGPIQLDEAEIRERMSGNLCRCGAYVNIVSAIREAANAEAPAAPQ